MEMGCVEVTKIDPDDGTCVNALPYATMHADDDRPDEVRSYQEYEIRTTTGPAASQFGYDAKAPDIATLPPGSFFANWDCRRFPKKCPDRKTNGISHVRSSAWTADGKDAFEFHGDEWSRWRLHRKYHSIGNFEKRTVLTDMDVVAHTGFNPQNFGHILHDNLPVVAWLRSVLPETTIFLLPESKIFRKLLDFIDPDFVLLRVRWYKPNEIIEVRDGTLTVSDQATFIGKHGNTLWRHLRHWIAERHPERYPQEERVVVYYIRGSVPDEGATTAAASAGTKHGRVLDPSHERDVVASIRAAMARYNRTEELVFFTGCDDVDGNILSIEEQFAIFRRASAIIGPHGSGLANAVWTYPLPTECEERVKMLEIIPARDSAKVQVLYNGYYWNMRGMPLEWHQITYAANSTRDVTYIRLNDLERALDSMWGPKN